MKKTKKNKLKSIIRLSIAFIMALQLVIFIGVIGLNGTFSRLNASSEKILENMVETRSRNLEEQMLQWTNISQYEKDVQTLMGDLSSQKGRPISQIFEEKNVREQFFDEVFPVVLETLRTRNVTDCFIILDSDGEKQDALYLRDIDPMEDSAENSDVIVVAGSSEPMFKEGLTLDSLWTESFQLQGDAKEIYEQSVEVGNLYEEDALDLGHYSRAFRFRDNDLELITYMIPLRDENNHAFGVIGVGLSLDYLRRNLDSGEIVIDGQASYYLGIRNEGQITTVLTQGGKFRSVFSPGSVLKCRQENNMSLIQDVDACMYDRELSLYNTNTPFEKECWFLGGIVRESALKASSRNLLTALMIAITVSIIVSILGAYWVTERMTKPINMLMQGMKNVTFGQISLPRTNVYEIDELAEAVEKQGERVIREGAKMADIIHMSNLKLGITEYDKENDAVFFAGKLLEMLELPADIPNGTYIDAKRVKNMLADVKHRIKEEEEEEENIYCLTHKDGKISHIHVLQKETEKEIIYVCQDVTETINEKKKIRHDRDYDTLTNLYNRGAFYRNVNRLIEDGSVTAGVMVVWDLDNLKYVNDSYGHDMGDRYICLMAKVLKKYENSHCFVSRRSGDEYMAFVCGQDVEKIKELIVSIHNEVMKQRIVFTGGQIRLSASGGMAVYGRDGETYEELLNNADFAMYESKRKVKGGIREFNLETYQEDKNLMENAKELDRIISQRDIRFEYEPVISVLDQRVFAFKALPCPVSDVIENQTDLKRLAESRSQLHPLETVTLNCALEDFFGRGSVPKDRMLFMDSVSNQCLEQDEYAQLEEKFGKVLNRFAIELVGNARTKRETEEARRQFCEKNHIKLVLKDLGADCNSIDTLPDRGFDFVKLSANVLCSICDDAMLKEVRQMIASCHKNGLKVISEGIETKKQLEMMMQLGADYVQGSYFTADGFSFEKDDYADKFK